MINKFFILQLKLLNTLKKKLYSLNVYMIIYIHIELKIIKILML